MDLRQTILAIDDRPTSGAVHVPEWGLDVHYRTFELEDEDDAKAGQTKGRAALGVILARGLAHADGSRIFTDEDGAALCKKHPGVVLRLANAIIAHNGLTPEKVDELEKKSVTPPSFSSPSDSPASFVAPYVN